jgi:hypothetical protein
MHDLRSSFVIYIKSHPLTKFPRRETLDPFIDSTSSPLRRRRAEKVIFVMFFKAIALLLAAIVGYYIFNIDSQQGAIFLALPVSAIAVVLLLGWSG